MLEGKNIICLDLETKFSADDCRHCGKPREEHYDSGACEPWEGDKPSDDIKQFSAIGWERKVDLGLSIGCWWDYQDAMLHWFDVTTLEATVRYFVERKPLLVSFSGISFDFSLMRALLRRYADGHELGAGEPPLEAWAQDLRQLCDTFKVQCATSYDILAEIWKIKPKDKSGKGLNSLQALCQANGFPLKEMDGATAPRLWAQGRYAEVIAYNVGDVLRTKQLFERICARQSFLRGDGLPITLPLPAGLEVADV